MPESSSVNCPGKSVGRTNLNQIAEGWKVIGLLMAGVKHKQPDSL